METKNKKWVGLIIALILILTIVITKCSNSTPLPAYNGDGDPTPTPASTPAHVDGETFKDEDTGASLFVPSGFTYLMKSGYKTFIHSASETSIQIQNSSYSPQMLSINETVLQNEISNAGGTMLGFSWRSQTQYTCIYSLGDIVFYEATAYDRNTVVRIVCRMYSKYYESLNETMNYVVNSFKWTQKSPFPDEFNVYYNEFGNFEFGVPVGWNGGIVDNAYFAQDEKSGASMSVNVYESDASYTDVSQTDYVTYMQQNYPNYIVQSFANDSRIIYSTGTYSSNNTRYIAVCYMLASGTYEYSITFICPYDKYNDNAQTYTDAINLFRIF